jgi:hypothetical protein
VPSGGAVDEDYTTTVLRGSQSLYLLGADSASARALKSITASGTVYGHFMLRVGDSTPSEHAIFYYMRDSNPTTIFQITARTDGRIRVYHGSVYLTSTNAELSDNTTYHLWYQFVKGTGADGVYKVWIGASHVFSSAELIIDGSNGDGNADVVDLTFSEYNGILSGMIIDQVIISTESIGDVCE